MKVSNFSISPTMFAPGDEVLLSFTVKAESGDTIGSGGLTLWLSIPGYGETSTYKDASFTISKGQTKNVSVKTVLKFGSHVFARGDTVSNFGVQLGSFGSRVDVTFPLTLLDAWYRPGVRLFTAERSTGETPDDEGENLLMSIHLGKSALAKPEVMSMYLYYQDRANPEEEPAVVTLTGKITDALANEIQEVLYKTLGKNSDWDLLLWFGDEYESVTARFFVSRAFANVHLSGASTGGVCFGSFSKATENKPLFQCYYPAEFEAGIRGVTSYVSEEIPTGGTWIDGKPIYRRVMEISVATLNSRVDVDMNPLPNVETLIDLRASLIRPSDAARRFPACFWFSDANYHSVWMGGPNTLSVKTSSVITGYVIIEYTKSEEASA